MKTRKEMMSLKFDLKQVNEKIANLSSRERVLLLTVAILAVFVLFWQFIFQPYQQERDNLESDIQNVRESNQQIMADIDEWEDYQEDIDTPEDELSELERELPGHQELEYTFYEIATILYNQDIGFDTIYFTQDEGEDELEFVELNGNLQGSYINIYRTLEQLEEMDRLINVTEISITAMDDTILDEQLEENSQEVNVAFEMEFYWDDIAETEPNRLDPEDVDLGKLDPFVEVE